MKYILILFLSPFFISCNTQPEPLVAGKDVCSYCKMPVADTKFGAEIITEKGKFYKFDDVICMLNFMKEGIATNEKIKSMLVVCYTNNQKLIKATEAFFLVSSEFHTSMNSGAACFESLKDAQSFQTNFPGKILSWQELNQTLH